MKTARRLKGTGEPERWVSLDRAVALAAAHAPAPVREYVPVRDALGRVLLERPRAATDVPNADTAAADGYAVRARDLTPATAERPVLLPLAGRTFAGDRAARLPRRAAWRVLTGAAMPAGADTVVAEEDCELRGREIAFARPIPPGRNVAARGSDLEDGTPILSIGRPLSPGDVALAAAAGVSRVSVAAAPTVAVLEVGSELVEPGRKLRPGKRYGSNGTMLAAWCARLGAGARVLRAPDDVRRVRALLQSPTPPSIWITAGGSGGSERDRVWKALEGPGWRPIFRGLRMRPGRNAGLGLLAGVPVFTLPGGASGCEIGFLLLAAPALLAAVGRREAVLPSLTAVAAEHFPPGKDDAARVHRVRAAFTENGRVLVHRIETRSRLASIAETDGLLIVPEGSPGFRAGTVVRALWTRGL